jgi:signal transduction histidine kinase
MPTRCDIQPSGRTILVVDDDVEARASVRTLLELDGHHVLTADSGAGALRVLDTARVQLLLIDYAMPVMNGEELVRRVRERERLAPIVLQTDPGEMPSREMLGRLAIQGCHDKSDGSDRLLMLVDVALRYYDQLAQLEVAERLKTELLGAVSHEFRTPLNVIVGYVDLMREGTFGPCSPETTAALDKVRQSAGWLLELVEEFLDLSKLESGATVVRYQAVSLAPFLRELGEWFTLLVRGRPIEFVIDVADDLPPVAAEPAKLRVVIQNLLSNAAKFTSRGTIRVSAESLGDGRVAIRVADTGPGIAAEDHEAIFDVFHQLRPDTGETKGVGLGLALARRFARMMGGDITLESTVGAGSTFTLVLPGSATTASTVPGHAA